MLRARAAALALALVAAGAVSAACARGGEPEGAERYVTGEAVVTYVSADSRDPAPALAGKGLDGADLSLAALRGNGVAVVNVWGAWCVPCRREQPHLERVWRETRSRGVVFVGIDIRDDLVAARRHVQRYGVTYPSFADEPGRLLTLFETVPKSPPATYVVDRSGRVAAYVFGVIEEEPLRALVERVLAEPGGAAGGGAP